MNNIEFILNDAGITSKINSLTNDEKKFIKEKLIKHYEFMRNPIFGNEHTIINEKTGEVKTLKTSEIAEIIEKLKEIVK